jgi:predicted Ser/Thr protein kinase
MLGQSCPKPKPEILTKSRSDEIDRIDLQIAKSLGSGDFATVFYGTFLGKAVVIKSLKTGSMDPQAFLKEVEIMRLCNTRRYNGRLVN